MITAGRVKSMRYLVTTLTQIANTLSDFGFKEESAVLERVSRELHRKLPALGAEKVDRI